MKKLILFTLLMILCGMSFAQKVSGTVTDAYTHEPIFSASVRELGTSKGAATDMEGKFSFTPSKNEGLLVVSFVGYEPDTLPFTVGESMQISLKAKMLESVVVKARQSGRFQKLNTTEQTETITIEGLRGLACCNLGESFENSASVDVGYSDAVSGSKQIQLLGLTGIYSQMLLENTPFLRGLSAPFGLGYVPGQWMEGISVSKGVATVKNGYEAITGTINLDYEKPHKGDLASVALYANSDLKGEITTKLNIPLSERLSTGLYLFGTLNNKPQDHLGCDGFMDVPLQKQYNILNRWNYEKPGGLCSQTIINYTHEERLGGQLDFNKELQGNDSIYGFGGNSNRIHFMTKNGFPIGQKASFGSQIVGSHFEQDAFYGLSSYKGKESFLYANLLMNAEVGHDNTIDYGISMRYNQSEEQLLQQFLFVSSPYDGSMLMQELVPGAFGQFTYRFGDLFTATAGLRYDYNTLHHRNLITPRLHFRLKIGENFVLRGVGGKGYRTANIFAENLGILASSRDIVVKESLGMEEAWNGGLNLTKKFTFGEDNTVSITADYYHTNFVNQVVVDYDIDAHQAVFSNLEGRSYSNVFQLDITGEFFDAVSISLAGKINDVWCTYHGELMQKPFTSKYKGLLVLSYHTPFTKWRFDFTTQLNGPQRIPLNVGEFEGESSPYFFLLGQITRKFKHFEVYAGCENITNHTQEIPVLGAEDPFGPGFDASIVYAPLMGRLWYAGLRYNIK